MAYDKELAGRIRAVLSFEPGITEKAMFGGLAFLREGNMLAAASGKGGIMLRVDPAVGESLVDDVHVHPFEMHGNGMRGWLRVDEAAAQTEDALRGWLEHALEFVRTLPAK
jgi:TfoX/Sxy family transcriptional regulator of competence genes